MAFERSKGSKYVLRRYLGPLGEESSFKHPAVHFQFCSKGKPASNSLLSTSLRWKEEGVVRRRSGAICLFIIVGLTSEQTSGSDLSRGG